MNKEDVLKDLNVAKQIHITLLQKARAILDGADILEIDVPGGVTECKFNHWLSGDGQTLKALSNNPASCMENIEKLNSNFHDAYLAVYSTYFLENAKVGFFAKLFSAKKREITAEEKAIADAIYLKMKKTADEIREEIERLERRLQAVSDEKISSLGQIS